MSEENKRLMHRWFEEVWTKGDANAIAEMASEDMVIHGLTDSNGTPVTGAQAFREFHKTFRSAFPNIVIEVEDCIAEGDKVVARCAVRGKHTGHSLGIAPTSADVDFTGIAICRIREGKIVEAWNNFDFMRLNRQLGVS
jgi:steroid delta-isomerase-like uncharacterized protein